MVRCGAVRARADLGDGDFRLEALGEAAAKHARKVGAARCEDRLRVSVVNVAHWLQWGTKACMMDGGWVVEHLVSVEPLSVDEEGDVGEERAIASSEDGLGRRWALVGH